jgi:hypothetical protein
MSSKKKPSFEVPEDLQGTPQPAGWVYKSGQAPDRRPSEPTPRSDAVNDSARLLNAAAQTVASGLAVLSSTVLLGARVLSLPYTVSVRMLRSFVGR